MRAHYLIWMVCGVCCSAAGGGRSRVPPAAAPVRPGIVVLLSDSAHLIASKSLGVLMNITVAELIGRRDVGVLRTMHDARLTMLFSPEHGFRVTEGRLVFTAV